MIICNWNFKKMDAKFKKKFFYVNSHKFLFNKDNFLKYINLKNAKQVLKNKYNIII